MHCGDQRHLGLCLGYVPALAYGLCSVSDQGTTLRASDLHNARAAILNPLNSKYMTIWINSSINSLDLKEAAQILTHWASRCLLSKGLSICQSTSKTVKCHAVLISSPMLASNLILRIPATKEMSHLQWIKLLSLLVTFSAFAKLHQHI